VWNIGSILTITLVMSAIIYDIDNNRMHDLTIEEVKSCSMFMHLSDEEVQEVIESLKSLCQLGYSCVQHIEKSE